MTQPEPALDFAAFQAMLAELLGVAPSAVIPAAYFITDLGVDSIKMVEILLRMEALGIEIQPELAYDIQTVGDAYQFYQMHILEAAADAEG